ncbi:hypothetical protein, partial [Xanthomonas oryzae]|uniref:hypothetical protein n=1 Tax=Xanthomonas oryzae TaxID=347 RepID=UPI001C4B460A
EQRLRIGGKQLLAENSTKRFYPAALGKSFRHLSACRNDTQYSDHFPQYIPKLFSSFLMA